MVSTSNVAVELNVRVEVIVNVKVIVKVPSLWIDRPVRKKSS